MLHLIVLLSLFLCSNSQLPLNMLFNYGPGAGDQTFTGTTQQLNDGTIELNFPNAVGAASDLNPNFAYFGNFRPDRTRLTLGVNGGICFIGGNALQNWIPTVFPNPLDDLIAPFWSDVDLNVGGSLYYRFELPASPNYLAFRNRLRSYLIKRFDMDANAANYDPSWCFVATWFEVGGPHSGTGRNTFQMVVCTDGVESYVVFLYNKLEWSLSEDQTMPNSYAAAGFNAGDGVNFYTLPSAFTPNVVIDLTLRSNTGMDGLWVYKVHNTVTGGTVTGLDVHFSTLDGLVYTFNAGGDYTYLQSPGKFKIHVRTHMASPTASVLAALALLDEETGQILEVWWDGKASNNIIVNKRFLYNSFNEIVNIKSSNTTTMINEKPFLLKHDVSDPKTKKLSIKRIGWNNFELRIVYHGRSNFQVEVDKSWKTEGLGGNNNGAMHDDLCNRSGECLALNATLREVHKTAMDWKVRKDELLFENWMHTQEYETQYHPLEFNTDEYNAGKQICGKHPLCLFDFLSTKSREYAEYTKMDYELSNVFYVGDVFS